LQNVLAVGCVAEFLTDCHTHWLTWGLVHMIPPIGYIPNNLCPVFWLDAHIFFLLDRQIRGWSVFYLSIPELPKNGLNFFFG
jgi:hypothetical protein